MRRAATIAALATLILISARAEELPPDPEPGSFEVEPPPLPGNLTPEPPANQPSTDLAQLDRKLARAREAAAGADRLFKIGVLAKLEAENRAIRVTRLEAEVAQARVAAAQLELDRKEQQRNAGEIAQSEVASAHVQLTEAKQLADIASANLKKAELDAAALNLARRQKLLALGTGGKSAVRRAEEKLAELKRNSQ